MHFRIFESLQDAEAVRRIRNTGASWMGDPRPVSFADQLVWFEKIRTIPAKDFFCYLAGEPPVGYGMVRRREDERLWITLAILPLERGKGIGTQIYDVMAVHAGEPVFAGIHVENVASRRACEKAGYRPAPGICPPGVSNPDDWLVLSRGR